MPQSQPQPGASKSAAAPFKVRHRRAHHPRWWILAISVALTVILGGWFALQKNRTARATSFRAPTVEVDRGDVPVYVVETGSLESTDNATVKCEVEAILGAVAAPTTTANNRSGSAPTGTRSTGISTTSIKAKGVAGAAGMTTTGAAKSVLTASGNTASTSTGTATAGAGAAGGMAGGGQAGIQAPTIRSFTYKVTPHVPLRLKPATTSANATNTRKSMGGGGSGGGFGGAQMDQKGSTTIIWILPEGTEVEPLGEDCDPDSSFDEQGVAQPCADCDAWHVVCRLDSAPLEDELLSQTVRFQQAESWVEQATALLEVNEISLKEYRDGLLPQDRALITGYKLQCDLELQRCRETMQWSTDALQKGFRTANQVTTDRLSLERAEVQEREAKTMSRRLEEYSAPRLISNLEAKSASIRSDLLAQKAALKVEGDRLTRIKKMIEYCTMWAPRTGVVAYANQASSWGRSEVKIVEGATVRERQPIFNLPNPNRMSVRVKINEAKISSIHTDQRAEILVDAFPDRPLTGRVTQVNAVSAPTTPMSDVRIYNALVEIEEGGFNSLKPGLTAEVALFVENRHDVVRVPVAAVRWVGEEPFAARVEADGQVTWLALELGRIGTQHAEVLSGVQPGDTLAAEPDLLPLPERLPVLQADADNPARLVRSGRNSHEWSRDDVAKSRQSRESASKSANAPGKKASKKGGNPGAMMAKFARISPEDRDALKTASESEKAAILKKAGFTDDELKQMREMAKGAAGGANP